MPRERTFFLVLATLIVAGFAVGHFSQSRREVQPELAVHPRPQAERARTWRQPSFVKTLEISPATGAPLVRPLSLKEERSGDLLVLDWSAGSVRRFSPSGEEKVSYHLPAGAKGGSPEDFDVDAAGNVWICYHDDGTVAELDPGGRLLQTWHLASRPHRVLTSNEEARLVAFAADNGPDLFDRYSGKGELLGGFGRLLAGGAQDLLTLDGDVAHDGAGGFVYVATHTGLLASYSLTGEPRFLVESIDPVPLPKLIENSGQPHRLAPGSRLAGLTVSVSGDQVYVLVDLPSENGESTRALDVYSNRDGKYLYSFKAPERTPFALVAGDRLYTIHEDVVTRWVMAPGKQG
ncbi:MAG TPA: hypothetical protein VF173_06810 [Thermoanaerobaculia bacterium]|nr:hypothetical protein [Thermoanaerobaculia bacterium]